MSLSSPSLLPNCSLIRSVYHMAGIYDLMPLLGTGIAEPIELREEEARKYSPATADNIAVYRKVTANARTRIVYGDHECPGLREQNEKFEEVGLCLVGF
jgi:hypothetical protein